MISLGEGASERSYGWASEWRGKSGETEEGVPYPPKTALYTDFMSSQHL